MKYSYFIEIEEEMEVDTDTTIKMLHSVNKSLFLPICINHLNKYLILSCSIYKLVHALMNLDMVIGCIYIPSEPWQKHCIMIF